MNKIKIVICFVVLIYMSICLVPYANFVIRKNQAGQSAETFVPELFENTEISTDLDMQEFVLYDLGTDTIITLSEKEFLIGSLASEMTATVKEEALKAQCVASYSYYSYLREQNKSQEYHIEFNSLSNQVYTNSENLKTLWAEDYDKNYEYFSQIIDSVYGETLVYNGEIACSSFFTVSNGNTESALDMWGEDIPYLVAVASPYDAYANGIESTIDYTPVNVKEILADNWEYADFDYTMPYSDWFSEIEYTTGASVVSLNICGFSVTGDELRKAFSLSSPCFEISYDGEKFVFTSKGQGGFVGMSKTGASYMAAEGASYKEILAWYFSGTTIAKE
ncbi:MAG: SpoIID/LytB domain-containing protein [Clostridia bacterium]